MVKKIAKEFIVFLSSAFFLLLAVHFLYYYLLADVFSFLPIFPFSAIVTFLFFSFVAIFIEKFLVKRFDNDYNRALYFIVAIWLGIAWQSCLIYLGLAVVRFLASFYWSISPEIFAGLFFLLTALLSWRGFYNAFKIRFKNIDLEIKNLPDFWVGKKIVQLSDVHLGAIYRQKFLSKISKMVGQTGAEAVLITGDLFDGTDGDFSEAGKQLLKMPASQGVFFVFGNHENRLGRLGMLNHLTGTGMELLDDRLVEIHGLQIIGISFPEQGTKKFNLAETIKSLPGFDSQKPSILMFHEPIQFEEVSKIGVDAYLAGHTHYGQMFPFNYLSSLVYHGFSKGVAKFNQLTAIISTGVGTWGPPCRTMSYGEIIVITLLKK
jgi:predicted MPP superfamily phosphohydrolase